MKPIRLMSAAEQVAAHLRSEILMGRLMGEMPGIHQLAAGLVANHKTVKTALGQLEKEGLLVSQGSGKPRRIVLTANRRTTTSLRVAVLRYEPDTRGKNYMMELVHQLSGAGHTPFSTGKTLLELGMSVERVANMVENTQADAWVVAGGSREVLAWFAARPAPVFAIFGRRRELPIAGAGPDKLPAMRDLMRRLIELGHNRIVLLARAVRRLPAPGAVERTFLSTLAAHGIQPGTYHLPDWQDDIDGFHRCLEELFRFTPPTALIVDEAHFFTATMLFCLKRGIRVPQDVSLVCCDDNPNFASCQPRISHIEWDSASVVRRIVHWASRISRGNDDRRQTEIKAVFIEGGTIGRAGS